MSILNGWVDRNNVSNTLFLFQGGEPVEFQAKHVKNYFDSLPDSFLNKYVVVSISKDKEEEKIINTLWKINGIMLTNSPWNTL